MAMPLARLAIQVAPIATDAPRMRARYASPGDEQRAQQTLNYPHHCFGSLPPLLKQASSESKAV
jgi:hypothetical protein